MKIISSVPVTPARLIASNVPETDAPAWSAGSYTAGQQVIFNHRVYEALSTTTAQPDVGAVAVPPSWIDLGADNRYRMFDVIVGSLTERTGTIEVTIRPGVLVNALAFFGLVGGTLNVVVTDPVDGEVYNRTEILQDNSGIVDWYAYFFDPIIQRTDLVLLDLPSYGSADIEITVDAGAGPAACGEAVIGYRQNLGVSNFGTSVSILDYSRKNRDDFGNATVVERNFSKRAEYDVTVETKLVSMVQRALAAIRATPSVFIGDEGREETIVFGFYRQFNIVLSNPSISDCTIEVEGLV